METRPNRSPKIRESFVVEGEMGGSATGFASRQSNDIGQSVRSDLVSCQPNSECHIFCVSLR